jgi:peptidoglycan/LPS O-acetylase OafA/YrhL
MAKGKNAIRMKPVPYNAPSARRRILLLFAGGDSTTKPSDNFTLIRLILALLVALSHSYTFAGRTEPVIEVGAFTVQCFFAISGYLVTGSYLTTAHPALFAWKRFWRIAPALVVAVPVGQLLLAWQDNYVSNPYPGGGIANGSLWTLSWEALLYVLVLILGLSGLLTAPVVSAALVTSLMLLFVHPNAMSGAVAWVASFFILFTAGGTIRLVESQIDLFKCGVLACAMLTLLYLPLSESLFEATRGTIVFVHGPNVSWNMMRRFLTLIALPFAVLFVCRRFPISLPIRADYSYGVYIFAWPIQQTLVYQLTKHGILFGPRILFAASAILSFGCAFVSWHLIEKNALRLSHMTAQNIFTGFRAWWTEDRCVSQAPDRTN